MQIAAHAETLEGASPVEVLSWAAEQYAPRLVFATAFGAEGCVLVDMIGRHQLPVDIFTLDTGLLFDETYELWQKLEQRYGLTIRPVRPRHSLDEQAALAGPALWETNPDLCCEQRKIAPLRTALTGAAAWITSIRRDQTAERGGTNVVEWDHKFGLVKINPLATWKRQDTWAYIRINDVPYNPLFDNGYASIGCTPCTTPVGAGEDPRAGRWRGRAKTECGLHIPLTQISQPVLTPAEPAEELLEEAS